MYRIVNSKGNIQLWPAIRNGRLDLCSKTNDYSEARDMRRYLEQIHPNEIFNIVIVEE